MFVNIASGKTAKVGERIVCVTLPSNNETLDSGFFSPVSNSSKMSKDPTLSDMLEISPMKMPISPAKIKTESIMSEMTDISISEEWEKDFFSNFEENLFNMDIDDRVLSDILKSPKGKAAMNEMIRSPKGKALVDKMMKSPKGKIISNRLEYGRSDESPGFSDAKKLSATPMKPEMRGMLKMSNSKRRLAMTEPNSINQHFSSNIEMGGNVNIRHNILKKPKTEYVPIQPKENVLPVVWPSKERLKFARAQFKKTLASAVQRASADSHQKKRVKFKEQEMAKHEKYPEIKQALDRPAGQVKSTKHQNFIKIKPLNVDPKDLYVPFMESNESTSSYYTYDDDSDEDETWTADLPFSGSQKRLKTNNGQSKRRKYTKYRN